MIKKIVFMIGTLLSTTAISAPTCSEWAVDISGVGYCTKVSHQKQEKVTDTALEFMKDVKTIAFPIGDIFYIVKDRLNHPKNSYQIWVPYNYASLGVLGIGCIVNNDECKDNA